MSRYRTLRRLAANMGAANSAGTLRVKLGTVTEIDAGAAADGTDALFVQVGADVVAAPYHASYGTRAVGDVVTVLLVNGSPIILGHVIGLPAL